MNAKCSGENCPGIECPRHGEVFRAMRSKIMCVCGHREFEHTVPVLPGEEEPDYGRECLPSRSPYSIDGDDGEEWCACTDFFPAKISVSDDQDEANSSS